MIWLEIISVRTAGHEEALAALDLCRSIRPRSSTGKLIELRVYSSASYDTDFSVHIRWELKGRQQGKTPFGLELGSALRNLGFVNHTLWMEVAPEEGTGGRAERVGHSAVADVV